MPPENRSAKSPEAWIDYAKADLAMATAPLPRGAKYENLCFHAQQAAEKAIKGVLIMLKGEAPAIHNIQGLIELLPSKMSGNLTLIAATRLTLYATWFRYPGEQDPIGRKEYREAVRLAQAVVDWAEGIISTHKKS